VHSTFHKYSQIASRRGTTANELLTHLLRILGYNDVQLIKTQGHLGDHYDPRTKTIALSENIYNCSSVAALGVACHELGHAMQHQNGYIPFRIRRAIIPVTNFASSLLMPLIIIGLIFNFGVEAGGLVGNIFLWGGITVFSLAVLVNLVTLPVEYEASNRAIQLLRDSVTLDEQELGEARKVLNAAALTYVAALLVSLLQLLRFLLIVLRRR
jgi:hypothetical protein